MVGQRIAADVILKQSADYAAMSPYWNLVNTLIQGIDAMKKAREKYLPRLPAEDVKQYDFRIEHAFMTNVYRDVVETLASKPFEKEVMLEDSDTTLDEFALDVDGSGNDLTTFVQELFFHEINQAIHWIFIDYAKSSIPTDRVITVEQAKAIGNRPYWSHVLGSNVLEAQSKMINGAETLTYIRIFEPGETPHVRIMLQQGKQAVYQLWREMPNKGEYELVDEGEISIGIIPMVPFITGRRFGKSFRFTPALRDAADLQLHLYRKENSLNHAEVMACFPMVAAAGVKPPKDAAGKILPVVTGPGAFLWAEPNGAGEHGSFQTLEPAGSSLTHLKATNEELRNQIRELGKMPLTAQSTQLTVITTAVAAGKAKTAVGAWTIVTESGLEQCFEITNLWLGHGSSNPKVKINREFDDVDASNDADKTQLTSMRKNKDLSQETYWKEMKVRRVLSDDFDAEAEKVLLAAEPINPANDPNAAATSFIQ